MDMKKEYMTPLAEVLELEAMTILATSAPGFSDNGEVEDGEELGRENLNTKPSNPNVWEQCW